MGHKDITQEVYVESVHVWDEVTNAPGGLHVEKHRHVSKLEVAIYESHSALFVLQTKRQVDSDGAAATSTLGTIDADNLTFRRGHSGLLEQPSTRRLGAHYLWLN